MRLASLGSGSRGNATLVEANGVCVLVDCGFSLTRTIDALVALGKDADDLTAVLVTHEHGDHFQGVKALAREFDLPVFMTAGTARATSAESIDRLEIVTGDRAWRMGPLEILPVPVPHDAREPVQFIMEDAGTRLGVLTDVGHISNHVRAQFGNCDVLFIEANHDRDLLWRGPYPARVKERIAGTLGHLSNAQAGEFLAGLCQGPLRQLVVGHISETNNRQQLVRECIARTGLVAPTTLAIQGEVMGWIDLSS